MALYYIDFKKKGTKSIRSFLTIYLLGYFVKYDFTLYPKINPPTAAIPSCR